MKNWEKWENEGKSGDLATLVPEFKIKHLNS